MGLTTQHPASFRDPKGFIFTRDGVLYRQVSASFQEVFESLVATDFYRNAVAQGDFIAAEILPSDQGYDSDAGLVLKPEIVPTISYPYEWSFSQLKDAALLTLDLAVRAMDSGFILKDASAFNIQFLRGKAVFIDSLSFEKYVPGEPWIAYGQFCRHFLAPLVLMSKVDPGMSGLLQLHLDGIPLPLASKLAPKGTRWNRGLFTHLHLHANMSVKPSAVAKPDARRPSLSEAGLRSILMDLRSTVDKLTYAAAGTEWGDYYSDTNYSDQAMLKKREMVKAMLTQVQPKPTSCWDLGANTGEFSRLASDMGLETVAWDIDPAAVEKAYQWVRKSGTKNLLPLQVNLTNPSPSIGWALKERASFEDRAGVDVVLALALIHHLVIGNNTPLPRVAEWFAKLTKTLIIEFVPKEDSQVQRMLASREDIFTTYDVSGFEEAFTPHFTLADKQAIEGTHRILYRMERK